MTVTPVKSGRGEICPTLSFLGRLAVWTPLSALPPAKRVHRKCIERFPWGFWVDSRFQIEQGLVIV